MSVTVAKKSNAYIHKLNRVASLPPLTEEELLTLQWFGHASHTLLMEGRGTPTDWYNILQRLSVTEHILRNHYHHDSLTEFKPCVKAILSVLENSQTSKENPRWYFTKEQAESVWVGLMASDQVFRQMRREVIMFSQDYIFPRLYNKYVGQPQKSAKAKSKK